MCARKHSVCNGCPWTMGHRRRPLHAACGLKARSAAGQATRGSPMKVGHWSRMSASDLVHRGLLLQVRLHASSFRRAASHHLNCL